MAMPFFAFPATLPTAVGPIPFPAFFLLPSALGATDIPGTYNSLIRLYTLPTLTGGMGIALCWGQYMGNSTVPPPLIPVPYPPPIGNCMSVALPANELYGGLCEFIEKGITAAMEAANSVVSDIESGVAAVNNAGLPVEIRQGGQEEGAGGLEISLAMNLGETMKFDPPVQGFKNKHVGSFDSIGGVIAGWVDRQTLEILNKLFTLPTIRVILPDIPSIFASDWDEFNKLVEAFGNNIVREDVGPRPEELVEVKTASDLLDAYETLEREIVNVHTSPLEQIYQIANAIPFFQLNEHYINFKVPWLSFAQIKDVIRDFEQTATYYQKQIDKYEDILEEYECPEPELNTPECIAVKVAEVFVVDLDAFVKSIQENIKVFQSWLNFPRDFILLKKQLADYIRQVACYLDTYSEMLGGWLNTIADQMVGYAEVYYTIKEIIKEWKKMLDIFVEFEDSCDICTNERFANFGWFTLLGLVIPEPPIIKFPKWPDLVIDFSNLKAQVDIEMPTVHWVLEPITLPRLPRIPFPDIPSINDLRLLTQIPPLPVLPAPPELPELPPLPAIPVVDLPTLPPPPKLPSTESFKEIIPLIEQILEIWCMIKKAFTPVPEAYLKDHITLLTNRPAYMIPLDLLKPKIGDVALI